MAARVRDVVWPNPRSTPFGHIAQDSPQAALQVLDQALRGGASLADFAERGRIVPELNDPAIREVFVFKYRLQYRVDAARVLVVAFLHGARDFATWQERQEQE